LPEREPLLRFHLPKLRGLNVYAIRTKDGKLLVRSEEELEEIEKEEEEGGEQTEGTTKTRKR